MSPTDHFLIRSEFSVTETTFYAPKYSVTDLARTDMIEPTGECK
jgi:hypothetical protein